MSFVDEFNTLPVESLMRLADHADAQSVRRVLARDRVTLTDFARLLGPAGADDLEALCRRSQNLTRQRFGKVIRLFAPLYLSNECINNCQYCGFSRDNAILRVTLSTEEVLTEARALKGQGFRNLLLVSGEHPKFVSNGYMEACVRAVREEIPGVSLEVGPMETEEYRPLARAGAEGLVVYQETYDREIYARMHTSGPKRNFDWRLETPERAARAGFRRLGIGALFGLGNWRREALSLAAHALHLLRHCWKAQLTVSLPRLRPCAGSFAPLAEFTDRDLVQLVAALRLLLPDVGIVLSTREPAGLRDGLIPLGVTMISAGSHTEPGGYTGAGRENLHLTRRGRILPAQPGPEPEPGPDGDVAGANHNSDGSGATEQFHIADRRTPAEVAEQLRRMGYEPVWKDWDASLCA